jgi:excisionase family DNA binding protein
MDEILIRLDRLEKLMLAQAASKKEVLNLQEASAFLELSPSHLYKMTSIRAIPFYKPNGKKVYFRRTELESWLLRNRAQPMEEIQDAVDAILQKEGGYHG